MGKRRFNDRDYEEWARLYVEEGLSSNQIAEMYDCNRNTVLRALDKKGIQRRSNGEINHRYFCYHEEWIRLYQSGLSIMDIAKMYNVSSEPICTCLKKAKIKARSNSESHRIYSLNEHYFDVIDTSSKAYIIGFICGDGCIQKNRNSIDISINRSDLVILEAIKAEMCYSRPIYFHRNNVILSIDSKHIKKCLINRYNITPNKSLIIRYPNNIPYGLNRHVVRGIFDADGYIHLDKKRQLRLGITSGSKGFLEDIQEILVNELGIKRKSLVYKYDNIWVLQYNGNGICKILYDYLYEGATIYLPRKKVVFEQVFGSEELQKGGEPQRASKIVI